MPKPNFSVQDAQNLVSMVERAPLQNMGEAKAVNELIQRFVAFFNSKQPKPRAEKTK